MCVCFSGVIFLYVIVWVFNDFKIQSYSGKWQIVGSRNIHDFWNGFLFLDGDIFFIYSHSTEKGRSWGRTSFFDVRRNRTWEKNRMFLFYFLGALFRIFLLTAVTWQKTNFFWGKFKILAPPTTVWTCDSWERAMYYLIHLANEVLCRDIGSCFEDHWMAISSGNNNCRKTYSDAGSISRVWTVGFLSNFYMFFET